MQECSANFLREEFFLEDLYMDLLTVLILAILFSTSNFVVKRIKFIKRYQFSSTIIVGNILWVLLAYLVLFNHEYWPEYLHLLAIINNLIGTMWLRSLFVIPTSVLVVFLGYAYRRSKETIKDVSDTEPHKDSN